MNKIGFAIKYASQGIATPLQLNTDGSWEKGVVDLRHIMTNVSPSIKAEGKCVILLTFDARGCYVAIARSVNGRPNDFASGWLYIPSGLAVSGLEVQQLLGEVRAAISDNDLTGHIAGLEQLFARSYPMRPAAMTYRPSNPRGGFAGRDTSTANLDMLLGEARYQPYYSEYQCVFLVQDFAQTLNDNVINLTKRPLVATCVVMPPTAAQIQAGFGPGVQILTADGIPFTQPVCVESGQSLQLMAVRKGYADITFSHQAVTDGGTVTLPRNNRWLRHIGPSDIRVFDKTNRRPVNAEVRVNDAIIGTTGIDMPESELTNTRLTVSANGYETFSTDQPLDRLPIEVYLAPAAGSFTARIELADGSEGHVTIDSRRPVQAPSPLKGYAFDGRTLRYAGGNRWTDRLIGFGAAVALGLIVWGGITLITPADDNDASVSPVTMTGTEQQTSGNTGIVTHGGKVDNLNNTDNQAGSTSTAAADTDLITDRAKAVDYLKKGVYVRDEMEKYADLKGLWDDLNNYNFNALKEKWASIFDAAGYGDTFNWEIKKMISLKVRDKFPACYCAPGEQAIRMKTYLKYLSNARKGEYPSRPPKSKKTTEKTGKNGGTPPQTETTRAEKASTQPEASAEIKQESLR